MTPRHYDCIVLGRSLGALTAAALLARRDFRVLLLGHGQRPASYRFEGHVLCRRPFTLLAGSSPAWQRVLRELAQIPRFRRRTEALDPMFCFLSSGQRMQVPPVVDLFAQEVDREFPEVRQLVDELYAGLAKVNRAADAAFEKDLVWPPGRLWERLETGRAAASLPYLSGSEQDLLAKFPAGHPYRILTLLPAAFGTDLAVPGAELPMFALARLHGSWTRGIQMLKRGEDDLAEFLMDRIEAHGGHLGLDRRVENIVVEHGRAVGVKLDGADEMTGAGCIVADQPGELVAELAAGRGITKQALRDWPRLTPRAGRFVVSLVVKIALLPDPLGVESFLVPRSSGHADARGPALHLQRIDPTAYRSSDRGPNETVLLAEMLLPQPGALTLLEAREAVLSSLREHFPFLDEHLLVVDSVHDGLPLYDFSRGSRRDVDRIHLTESAPGPEPMVCQWKVDPPGYLELAGEPVRGPIRGTYLVGKTVLPALGQEGELLAAWGVARLITRADRGRQKLRQQMWSKVEES